LRFSSEHFRTRFSRPSGRQRRPFLRACSEPATAVVDLYSSQCFPRTLRPSCKWNADTQLLVAFVTNCLVAAINAFAAASASRSDPPGSEHPQRDSLRVCHRLRRSRTLRIWRRVRPDSRWRVHR
jgi:hypothetical protein